MSMLSVAFKDDIELQRDLIAKLEEKCASCEMFAGKVPRNILACFVEGEYRTDNGPAMIAMASYDEFFAIEAPDYLEEEQYPIFYYLRRHVGKNPKFVVFSQKIYDALMLCSEGSPMDVRIAV